MPTILAFESGETTGQRSAREKLLEFLHDEVGHSLAVARSFPRLLQKILQMIPHYPVQYRFIRLSGLVLRCWNVRRRTLVWTGALADERSMHVRAQSTHRAQQTKTRIPVSFVRLRPRGLGL